MMSALLGTIARSFEFLVGLLLLRKTFGCFAFANCDNGNRTIPLRYIISLLKRRQTFIFFNYFYCFQSVKPSIKLSEICDCNYRILLNSTKICYNINICNFFKRCQSSRKNSLCRSSVEI